MNSANLARVDAANSGTLPNFLIVGAAKSGTTSLYHYLRQHPEVFMCQPKEPNFFVAQCVKLPWGGPGDQQIEAEMVKTPEGYRNLFANAGAARAVGEASVENLYHATAVIPHIRHWLGSPRIVILLRHPADRAFSAWKHLRRDHLEDLPFESALEEENCRKLLNYELIWHYKSGGLYSAQVRAYLRNFERVFIRLSDDLQAAPDRLLRDLFEFLEIDPSFQPETRRAYNVATGARMRWLERLVFREAGSFNDRSLERRAPFTRGPGRLLANVIEGYNRAAMAPETRARLTRWFRDDILKLGDLIERDLSSWLANP